MRTSNGVRPSGVRLNVEGGAATDHERAAALASAEGGVVGYLVECTLHVLSGSPYH
ncbi:hypothetical protein Tter_2467 [Thermobaculum terrenum ATCC BAA-798]|uniref:Uncharacterized protein n=1 Tax=Thermobaculum terrenum (strain ATCC BAA-798 / CCMEE 7001 / YNP1) TaxID=525904 RepID=D1CHY9_THET1|nr:hypothetical protein [Thermobaculum terrenum]ACZ43360.1 hypothetical protein Tter_2467 [Thermobaculum terrenum ATCC BAA-798]